MNDTMEKIDQLLKLVTDLRQSLLDRMSDGLDDLKQPIEKYMTHAHVDNDSFGEVLAKDLRVANYELQQILNEHEKQNEGVTEYLKKFHQDITHYLDEMEAEAPVMQLEDLEEVFI